MTMKRDASTAAVAATGATPHPDMRLIAGGTFLMGSEDFYQDEAPVHHVAVDDFWIEAHAVTNEQFARFVAATQYVTVAERPLDPAAYPGADPRLLVPGSWFSDSPIRRSICAFRPSGGATFLAPPGGTPTAPTAILLAASDIPWCMWPMRMRRPSPRGPARHCRPRRNGNMPRAVGWTPPSTHGAMNSCLEVP